MLRSLIKIIAIAVTVLMPLLSFGAESMKLRPVLSVVADEKAGQLSYPEGIGCNEKSIVVADTANGRLVRYSFQDKILKGGTEIKIPQIVFPIEVQLTVKGDIYVLDGKLRKLAQLNPEGAFVSYLEPQGVPEPAAFVPRSFKVDGNGTIYLLDIFGERVLMTDASGKYITQIPFPTPHGFFSSLAVKPNGDVLLLDSVAGAVYVARKSETAYAPFEFFAKDMGEYLNFATYLTTDKRGVVFIVDHDGAAIVFLGQAGAFLGRQLNLGWKSGLLFYPSQICVTPADEIIVADRNNSIVQIFEIMK